MLHFQRKNPGYWSIKETKTILQEIGGPGKILEMTNLFYERFKQDKYINSFLRDHSEPHGERLANWLVEKMGQGAPWSEDLNNRPYKEIQLADGRTTVVRDRTSAHFAAWFSPKRKKKDVGRRFKLKDCRIWMRLMFWSARDIGLFEFENFKDWFVEFIGHFIAIYEATAPPYAQESEEWSLNKKKVHRYMKHNEMSDL